MTSLDAPADVVYYTTAELAEISRYAPSYLRKLRHRNEGPPSIKPRGKVLYPAPDALAWAFGTDAS